MRHLAAPSPVLAMLFLAAAVSASFLAPPSSHRARLPGCAALRASRGPSMVAPTTETTETTEVSDTPYAEEFTSLVSELDTALTLVRNLKSRLQKLEKQVHRDTKALNKKANGKRARKPRDPNAPKSGFAKEGPVSDEMRKFLGLKKDELISRTDVTKRIHEYCKTKNLQNPADKRHIKADASLRKLLKMNKDDDLTFFNLQKYMKVHFPYKEGVFPTA